MLEPADGSQMSDFSVVKLGLTLIGLGVCCGFLGFTARRVRRNRFDSADPTLDNWDRVLSERSDIAEDLRHLWMLVPLGLAILAVGLVLNLLDT